MSAGPCPRCESTDIECDQNGDGHWIWCIECQACGPTKKTLRMATAAWNKMPKAPTVDRAAIAYMAEMMSMHEPFKDQEQNQTLRHLAQFGRRLLRGRSP